MRAFRFHISRSVRYYNSVTKFESMFVYHLISREPYYYTLTCIIHNDLIILWIGRNNTELQLVAAILMY